MERKLVPDGKGGLRQETLAEALERTVTDLEHKSKLHTRAIELMAGRLPAGERDEILQGLGIAPAHV